MEPLPFSDLEAARVKFPPGTRVGAPWKHRGSPVGAVEPDGHAVTDGGVMVRVRFDDGGVLDCPASRLEWVAAPALHFPSRGLPCPDEGCQFPVCAECARTGGGRVGLTRSHFAADGICTFGHKLEEGV